MSGAEQPAARAWFCFIRARAETRRVVNRELRARGLTGAQFAILRVLADSGEEGVKLNEISQRLCVTGGNITGLVDRLEEAGLLARFPLPTDRRVTLARLTPTGRALVEEVTPRHAARVRQVMSALTAQEQKLLADLLDRLADRAMGMEG